MKKFSTISSIDVADESTWRDKIFLTFDLDWAHDDVLNDTIDIVEAAEVAATWFVTHKTKVLKRLRDNPKFELGAHPNFNNLLNGDISKGKNARDVLMQIKDIIPESVSIRSHSMCQSSYLLNLFSEVGFTHDVNQYIPFYSNIDLKPWSLWNGLVRIPYNWEDDLYLISQNRQNILDIARIFSFIVFDFHPIHVYLNTENLFRYESIRNLRCNESLIKYKYEGEGVNYWLRRLLQIEHEF